ncbi:MAG: hypothetical protein ACRC2U_09860 [Aeromonas sp.]
MLHHPSKNQKDAGKKISAPLNEFFMRDLTDSRLMWLKAILFLGIGFFSAGLLMVECFSWRRLLLLVLCVWGFCRAYYFAFYVIQHWICPEFRFSGLWDFLRWCLKAKPQGREKPADVPQSK